MGSRQRTPGAVGPDTPAREAAAVVVAARLADVGRLLKRAGDGGLGVKESEKAVHALRVSTRRATAALCVFDGVVEKSDARKAMKRLRRIRRAAGEVRDLDVQAALLAGAAKRFEGDARRALRELAGRARKQRREALAGVAKLAEKWPRGELREKTDRLVERLGEGGGGMFAVVARGAMEREVGRVREASGEDLREIDRLHELRLELKRLRYTMEIAGPCMEKERRAEGLAKLAGVQRMLGEINDDTILVARLRAVKGAAKAERSALGAVVEEIARELAARHGAFLDEWKRLTAEGFLDRMAGLEHAGRGAAAKVPGFVEAKPVGLNGTHRRTGLAREGVRVSGKARRLAAIDVGTNSVRLIVAEAQADGSYRVLDDEKEITRLGKGLGETGRLDAGSIEHTAMTIARMRSIAEGYGAAEVRVVGTSAAREAKNTKDLAKQIRARSGLELEVISGEEEAVLAYRSAARAFDLSAMAGAVVDIGGGSTEIVLSTPVSKADGARSAGGALIERVYTLPLGAVRLTEMFGGAEACARERFDEMRRHIKEMLATRVGRPPTTPQMVIGTGGTFTTLGAMVMQRELGRTADGLFGAGVQGYEVGRADLKHLLEYVRKQPVKERTRVPGLSADRADIIVAGLAIVDGVMKWFEANRVRVHEGGIRDGILLGMVGEGLGEGAEARREPMKAVRRLAKACAYEAAHSKHVTGLALSIFDQVRAAGDEVRLEPGMRLDDEARLLLEASSLLHDIGYLINYAEHHKHSYHLIVHADLAGLTTRQVRVVANVARYHRAAEPKVKHGPFGALSVEDRALVRGLSGILRVADGLDRTHMQSVRGVELSVKRGAAEFQVDAEREPSVDVWGAVRKCGLFEDSFGVKCHFEWRGRAGASVGADSIRKGVTESRVTIAEQGKVRV